MQNQPFDFSGNEIQMLKKPWFDRFSYWVPKPGPLFVSDGKHSLHWHDILEICYCISGSSLLYIRDEIYILSPGDISIVYPGEIHDARTICAEDSICRFIFVRVPTVFDNWQDRETLIKLTSASGCRGRVCSPAENKRILPYLLRILEMQEENTIWPPDFTPIRTLLACLLYETRPFLQDSRTAAVTEWGTNLRLHKAVYPAVAYIMTHYQEPVSLEVLCQCCFISPSHLRRVFTAVFGVSPMAFLHKIRIRHACAALESSDDSILSIAEQCGYASLSSFNRQFQKILQMSPSAYRQVYRKKPL